MKQFLSLQVTFALLLAAAPLASATTYFTDTFNSGSTLNQSPTTNISATATSYQTYIGTAGGGWTISPGHLVMTNNSSSVLQEWVGMFAPTNTPVVLSTTGDYISVEVVFVDSNNILSSANNANSSLNLGLFNSGNSVPNVGNIVLSTGTTSGGTQGWLGYFGRIFVSGSSTILTRPAQAANGTTSQNQDALFSNASSTQAFNSPSGTSLGNTTTPVPFGLTNGSTYTVQLVITVSGAGTLGITNTLYNGAGTNGGVIFSLGKTASGATLLTGAFDAMAIGWRNTSVAAQNNAMDITSIKVTGSVTAQGPPGISSQPVPVNVATNGSCAYFVTATGSGLSYQWHRNGTNLIDGPNISGSASSLLAISPAGPNDVLPSANGYYVTISNNGGSTNSVTNFLALTIATNLTWQGNGIDWKLNDAPTLINWADPNSNFQLFNFGDAVTFDDFGGGGAVVLTGPYLAASSVTVTGSSPVPYTFQASSTGSFAGAGNLIYNGSVVLNLNNINTYTGGTIISNASALLKLGNYNGLGTGPVTFAKAGSRMEMITVGSASLGVSGDVIVSDHCTNQFDGTGTFSGVFLGNLSGTAGKNMTWNPNPTNVFAVTTPLLPINQRVRVYGGSTTYDANLVLNATNITLAPYNTGGNQIYNGVISGPGSVIQRGSGTTTFNGQNTFSGGTIPSNGSIGFGVDSTPTVGTVTSGPIGTGPFIVTPEVASASGSGTILASGGARTIANAVQYQDATNNQVLVFGGTNALTLTGPYALQAQIGTQFPTNRILQVNNTNSATTISGVISDGGNGYGFTKTGPGSLYLNGVNTYTGSTINNSSTTNNPGLLAGSGTIGGSVLVQSNSAVGGGSSTSIGTLTISGSLTNNGNVFVRVNKSLSPAQSNDMVSVTGAITNTGTGTVTVTNIGPALVVGDRLVLFSHAMSNGAAMTIISQPALSSGLVLSNTLAIDGSVKVVAVSTVLIPTIPARISNFSIVGANVVINGTNGVNGGTYYLLDSTNVALPFLQWLSAATNVVSASGGSASFTFTGTNVVTPNGAQQFYILSNTNNH